VSTTQRSTQVAARSIAARVDRPAVNSPTLRRTTQPDASQPDRASRPLNRQLAAPLRPAVARVDPRAVNSLRRATASPPRVDRPPANSPWRPATGYELTPRRQPVRRTSTHPRELTGQWATHLAVLTRHHMSCPLDGQLAQRPAICTRRLTVQRSTQRGGRPQPRVSPPMGTPTRRVSAWPGELTPQRETRRVTPASLDG
jgi:hypothetical protein